jgi:hypothetical protein
MIVVLSVFLLLCSMVSPLCAADDNRPSGDLILADLFMVRPLGLAAIVIGAAASVVATPFALASGSPGAVYEKLVADPFRYTITRPLGSGL